MKCFAALSIIALSGTAALAADPSPSGADPAPQCTGVNAFGHSVVIPCLDTAEGTGELTDIGEIVLDERRRYESGEKVHPAELAARVPIWRAAPDFSPTYRPQERDVSNVPPWRPDRLGAAILHSAAEHNTRKATSSYQHFPALGLDNSQVDW